jgi:hypothetical protein
MVLPDMVAPDAVLSDVLMVLSAVTAGSLAMRIAVAARSQ